MNFGRNCWSGGSKKSKYESFIVSDSKYVVDLLEKMGSRLGKEISTDENADLWKHFNRPPQNTRSILNGLKGHNNHLSKH